MDNQGNPLSVPADRPNGTGIHWHIHAPNDQPLSGKLLLCLGITMQLGSERPPGLKPWVSPSQATHQSRIPCAIDVVYGLVTLRSTVTARKAEHGMPSTVRLMGAWREPGRPVPREGGG